MDKEVIKEFKEELNFFHLLARRDIEEGFTINQVEDMLDKCSTAFYGSRIDFDELASKKCSFIAVHYYQIIEGNIEEDLEEFYSDINNKKM